MSEGTRGLDSVLADALADLANRSLELDPAHRARLAALEGRRVQLTAQLPQPMGSRDFALTVAHQQLRFFPHAPESPNVIVRGTPADLAAWLFGAEGSARSRLAIDGDVAVLGELRAALTAFRPDLGTPLQRLLGPDFAQAALGTAELALATLRSVLEGAGHGVRDSAARSFAERESADRFLDELDDLRLRVDRLNARIREQEQRENRQ